MKIIFVNKPFQNENTKEENLEFVEYVSGTNSMIMEQKVPHWCVKSEMLKVGETIRQWMERKWDSIQYASEHSISVKDRNIEGFYIYDIQPIGGFIGKDMEPTGEVSMMIRWDYIYRNSLKI